MEGFFLLQEIYILHLRKQVENRGGNLQYNNSFLTIPTLKVKTVELKDMLKATDTDFVFEIFISKLFC